MRKFLIPVIAASVLAFAAPAAAAEEVTVVVSFADLNLASPAGRETLEGRIAAAVTHVCGKPAPGSPQSFKVVKDCRSDAMEDAMKQLEAKIAGLPPVAVAAAR